MQVKDAMVSQDNLVLCAPTDTIQIAMEKMVENNVGSVIITDTKMKPKGIVTSQDIMRELIMSREQGFNTKISKVMTSKLITIDEFESINDAIQLLQESSTHHLIITRHEKTLAGIISSFDIVRERAFDIKAFPWTRK